MPIYEYRCRKCGAASEFLVGLGEDEPIACTRCGSSDMERILSAPSFLGHAMERVNQKGERLSSPLSSPILQYSNTPAILESHSTQTLRS